MAETEYRFSKIKLHISKQSFIAVLTFILLLMSVSFTWAATKTAVLEATPESGTAPLTVQLDARNSGIPSSGITRAQWEPGDGGTISGLPLPSTTYTYTTPGTYTAVYSFMADQDYWEVSAVITVEQGAEPMELSLEADIFEGTTPFAPLFTHEITGGTSPYTYEWDFGNGDSSNEEVHEYTYDTAGEYICRLTVTDSNNEQAFAEVIVKVIKIIALKISPPFISFSQPGDSLKPNVQAYYSNGNWKKPGTLKWQSENEEIAYVNSDSETIIAGTKEGTTTITASTENLSASVQVTVNYTPVSMDVSPGLEFITISDSFIPEVFINYSDGSRRTTEDFTLAMVPGTVNNQSISLQGTTITGINEGTSHVIITALGLNTKQIINVAAPEPLNVIPGAARAKPGEKIEIVINGGQPPFSVTDGSLDGSILTITVPSEPGNKQYVISDNAGQVAIFNLNVLSPLKLSSDSTGTLTPGESITYSPSGGLPPYTWNVTAGKLYLYDAPETEVTQPTNAGSKVTYHAPVATGVYTVTMTDSSGQSIFNFVTTVRKMLITPAEMYLSKGEERKFIIVGGKEPYEVTFEAGELSKDDTSHYTYTAPNVIGNYTVTITDNAGTKEQLNITVSHPLWVSPRESFLDLSEEKIFKLSGGLANDSEITLKAMRGTIPANPENREFKYIAPTSTGPDFIFITDANGDEAKVKIEVTPDFFFVTPSVGTLFQEEEKLFRVVGGTGSNFQWATQKGEIKELDEFSSRRLHTAYELITGTEPYSIDVSDEENNKASASIYVITDKVIITPEQVFLKPGEQATFKALFGTGEYKFSFTDGSIEKVADHPEKIIYTAPSRVGEFYVTVYDTAGNSAQAIINIAGGTKKPPVSATMIHDIKTPENWPNSKRQPIGAGDVQSGGSYLEIAADFPNYRKADGTPIPMNYYLALYAEPLDGLWLFWGEDGLLHTIDDITPLMSHQTDAVYKTLLGFELCAPDKSPKELIPQGNYQLFALAVESGYDPGKTLNFISDAIFELWQIQFTFNGCSK